MTGTIATPTNEAVVQGLVTEIMQIRANLDQIATRENKLRRAIQYFAVERDSEAREENLSMSRSFNRFSMRKPMQSFDRLNYSTNGSLLDHTHIYTHLGPKRGRQNAMS